MALAADKCDPELGKKIHIHLKKLNIETPTVGIKTTPAIRTNRIKKHFTAIMTSMGMDLTDDSLKDTPNRVAKMFVNEIFFGLSPDNFPKCTVIDNKMGYNEMVLEKNIGVMSVCEHHFVAINGKAHVAYIPKNKVAGLSKLNRVVEYFARRPQVQERLTEQVFASLAYILDTQNVAVVIEAEHFCVKMRGVEDPDSITVTSRLGGVFKEGAPRAEFMNLIKG